MKKTLLGILVIALSITGLASADTGAKDYYNANKAVRTFNVGELGAVIYTSVPVTGLRQEKVICNKVRNMCYVSSDALRVFKFNTDLFQQGQEQATGKKVNFRDFWNIFN